MDRVYDFFVELGSDASLATLRDSDSVKAKRKTHKHQTPFFPELAQIMTEAGLSKHMGRTILSTLFVVLPALINYCKDNGKPIDPLLDSLNMVIPVLSGTRDTRITYLSRIRSIVKQTYGGDAAEYKTARAALVSPDTRARNREYMAGVAQAAGERKFFPLEKLNAIVEKLKISKLFPDKVALCILASGARICEAIHVGHFEEDPDFDDYVIQTGVAKNREGETLSVRKPLLFMTPAEFLELITAMRVEYESLCEDKSHDEYLPTATEMVNTRIAELFGDGITSHKLRAMYGSMAHAQHCAPSETLQHFLARVLGHAADNIVTANSYANVGVLPEEKIPEGAKFEDEKKLLPPGLLRIGGGRQTPDVRAAALRMAFRVLHFNGRRHSYTHVRELCLASNGSVSKYVAACKAAGHDPGFDPVPPSQAAATQTLCLMLRHAGIKYDFEQRDMLPSVPAPPPAPAAAPAPMSGSALDGVPMSNEGGISSVSWWGQS